MNRAQLLNAYAQFRSYFQVAEPWESLPVHKSAAVIYGLLQSSTELELDTVGYIFDRVRAQLQGKGNLIEDGITTLSLRLHTGDGQYLVYRLNKAGVELENYVRHPEGIYIEDFEVLADNLLKEGLIFSSDLRYFHNQVLRRGEYYRTLEKAVRGACDELLG